MNNSINNGLNLDQFSSPPTAEGPNNSKNLLNSLDEIASHRSQDSQKQTKRVYRGIPTQPSEDRKPSLKLKALNENINRVKNLNSGTGPTSVGSKQWEEKTAMYNKMKQYGRRSELLNKLLIPNKDPQPLKRNRYGDTSSRGSHDLSSPASPVKSYSPHGHGYQSPAGMTSIAKNGANIMKISKDKDYFQPISKMDSSYQGSI